MGLKIDNGTLLASLQLEATPWVTSRHVVWTHSGQTAWPWLIAPVEFVVSLVSGQTHGQCVSSESGFQVSLTVTLMEERGIISTKS